MISPAAADAPVVRFPPDGAVLRQQDAAIPLKLSAGVLPLTVLLDGRPVLTGLRRRETLLHLTGPGFTRISVIDAQGRSDSVAVRLQ